MLFCELFFEKDLSFNDWPYFLGRGKMFSGSFAWKVGGFLCIRWVSPKIYLELGLLVNLNFPWKLSKRYTPRETYMSPENQWLEDVCFIEIVHFVGDILVFRGVWILDKIRYDQSIERVHHCKTERAHVKTIPKTIAWGRDLSKVPLLQKHLSFPPCLRMYLGVPNFVQNQYVELGLFHIPTDVKIMTSLWLIAAVFFVRHQKSPRGGWPGDSSPWASSRSLRNGPRR